MALKDLVTVTTNNDVCVILEIKPNSFKELIKLGCFNGKETIIRLTKSDAHTCTIWEEGGKSYSWNWGIGGHTLVSEGMNMKRRLIVDCIVNGFKINMGRYV